MYPNYHPEKLSFAQQLINLLAIIIVLGFVYGLVPTSLSIVRAMLGMIQLAFMALTMWITIRRVLEDY